MSQRLPENRPRNQVSTQFNSSQGDSQADFSTRINVWVEPASAAICSCPKDRGCFARILCMAMLAATTPIFHNAPTSPEFDLELAGC